jgi:hypothetical protein
MSTTSNPPVGKPGPERSHGKTVAGRASAGKKGKGKVNPSPKETLGQESQAGSSAAGAKAPNPVGGAKPRSSQPSRRATGEAKTPNRAQVKRAAKPVKLSHFLSPCSDAAWRGFDWLKGCLYRPNHTTKECANWQVKLLGGHAQHANSSCVYLTLAALAKETPTFEWLDKEDWGLVNVAQVDRVLGTFARLDKVTLRVFVVVTVDGRDTLHLARTLTGGRAAERVTTCLIVQGDDEGTMLHMLPAVSLHKGWSRPTTRVGEVPQIEAPGNAAPEPAPAAQPQEGPQAAVVAGPEEAGAGEPEAVPIPEPQAAVAPVAPGAEMPQGPGDLAPRMEQVEAVIVGIEYPDDCCPRLCGGPEGLSRSCSWECLSSGPEQEAPRVFVYDGVCEPPKALVDFDWRSGWFPSTMPYGKCVGIWSNLKTLMSRPDFASATLDQAIRHGAEVHYIVPEPCHALWSLAHRVLTDGTRSVQWFGLGDVVVLDGQHHIASP